ncbi:hypothetical protein [Zoogloea oleivorans]|jgi:hypothetical protein|uniref:hypothetical protein n=1 Tax=Zoogloea oleivorans TaxID=1552750 RepID=UPI002A3690CB|nr:hypothetical protein [Zoogloea oleivorans]
MVLHLREDLMSKGEGLCLWVIVWLLALIVYGLAGTSDLQTMADLTVEVDRVAVTECRQ